MKKEEEIYCEWICRRQSVPVPEGFEMRLEGRMMNEIAKRATPKRFEFPDAYRVFSSRPIQWAVAAGALLLGLFRLSYVTSAILIP
jgi:hypothetical protein